MSTTRYSVGEEVTIASGQTTSGAFSTADFAWGEVTFPAALTGTTISYLKQTKKDGAFTPVYYPSPMVEADTLVTSTFRASVNTRIPDAAFGGLAMKIVSASSEGAVRVFEVYCHS